MTKYANFRPILCRPENAMKREKHGVPEDAVDGSLQLLRYMKSWGKSRSARDRLISSRNRLNRARVAEICQSGITAPLVRIAEESSLRAEEQRRILLERRHVIIRNPKEMECVAALIRGFHWEVKLFLDIEMSQKDYQQIRTIASNAKVLVYKTD